MVGANAKNSMSLNRAPAPHSEGVRGNPSNYPFWPGGFPDPVLELMATDDAVTEGALYNCLESSKRFITSNEQFVSSEPFLS